MSVHRKSRPMASYSTLHEFGTYEDLSTPSYSYNQSSDHDL